MVQVSGAANFSGCTFEAHKFASRALAEESTSSFDWYIELRVRGTPRDLAAIEAFNMIEHGVRLDNADQIGMACDVNPYVKERYQDALESKDVKEDLWTLNEAVNQLLRLVKDPRVRESTRLNAIVHLNVMCGWVVMTEGDSNKVQQTIADFERQNAEWREAGGNTSTAH